MIGGSLLLDGIRSMTGHRPAGFGGSDSAGAGHAAASPWSNSAAGSDLARQAGLDDIGRSPTGGGGDTGSGRSQGLFGTADNDASDADDAGDVDDDLGGGFDLGGGEAAAAMPAAATAASERPAPAWLLKRDIQRPACDRRRTA